MNKYNKTTLQKVEEIFSDLNYTIRYEKGNFKAGYCILESKKVVVLNKFFDTEGRVNVLLDLLPDLMPDENILPDKLRNFYRNLVKNREFIAQN